MILNNTIKYQKEFFVNSLFEELASFVFKQAMALNVDMFGKVVYSKSEVVKSGDFQDSDQ